MMRIAERTKIGIREAQNRFVALPMEANDAETAGAPSERTIARYSALARGQWGVIMIEAVAPGDDGRSRNRQLVLTKKTLADFQKLIDAMRAKDSRTLITIQLNHAGRYALAPGIAYHHDYLDKWHTIDVDTPVLTTDQLDRIADEMAAAAALVGQTGADGVDVKCCHGYLAVELMRPANTRSNRWGGAFENRFRFMRLMLDALKSVKENKQFLIGSRISLFEPYEGGLGDGGDETEPLSEDLQKMIDSLREAGASWICETAGNPYADAEIVRPSRKNEQRFETMNLHHRLAARVKKYAPDFAVIGTGYTLFGADLMKVAEENLEAGRVDFIGLGRQNFADPETPKKLLNGDAESVRWCRACEKNNCAQLLRARAEAGCAVHDPYYRAQLKMIK